MWDAFSSTVRGLSHFKTGKPCQDFAAVRVLENNDVLICCVADGGGSADLSEIGSEIACGLTLNALAQIGEAFASERGPELFSKERMREIWTAITKDIRTCFEEEAKSMRTSPNHFGCTLLAVIATPDRAAMMQIGDGFIVYSKQGADAGEFELAFVPWEGEFVGQTIWVTSSEWSSEMQCRIVDGGLSFLCVSSDGIDAVAIKRPEKEPHPGYFSFLQRRIDQGQLIGDLVDTVLNDPRLDKKTDDDKSMVLAHYASSPSE